FVKVDLRRDWIYFADFRFRRRYKRFRILHRETQKGRAPHQHISSLNVAHIEPSSVIAALECSVVELSSSRNGWHYMTRAKHSQTSCWPKHSVSWRISFVITIDGLNQSRGLLGLTKQELTAFMSKLGELPYRARQLFASMHNRRITSFDAMTDLPKTLRQILDEHAVVTRTSVESVFTSSDGTRRFLLKLGDGREVEAVFMPQEHRATICISSQVGCPLACDFCMTGVVGLKRNMTAGEIVSQVVIVLNDVYGVGVETPHRT